MEPKEASGTIFYSGGFLYNPKTSSVLLHKRDLHTDANPGKWAFFGGTSEHGESPDETFIREIKEELGIEVSGQGIFSLRKYWNEERQIERHVFFAKSEMKKSEMTLGEGEDFEWVPMDKIFEYDLTEKTADDLKFFLETL